MKKINLYLTKQMIEKLDNISKETGINKSEIIRRAISEYFKKK